LQNLAIIEEWRRMEREIPVNEQSCLIQAKIGVTNPTSISFHSFAYVLSVHLWIWAKTNGCLLELHR